MRKPLDYNNIEISITVCGDSEIKKLNKKYLKRDISTDVLSFNIDQESDEGTFYLGDVIVNKDQAQRQCKKYGNSLEKEIAELASHGILHLLGVHHKNDDENGVHGVKS